MTSALDEQSLGNAFQGRLDIQTAIRNAANAGPAYVELFNQISQHVCSIVAEGSSEPAAKKRRLDDLESRPASNGTIGHATTNGAASTGSAVASGSDAVLLEIKDISVVIPQRKKYSLCFTSTHLYAKLPGSNEPAAGCSFAWSEIARPRLPPIPEPLVFTIADAAPKPGVIGGRDANAASAVSDEYKTLIDWALSTRLKAAGKNIKVVEADPRLFASEIRQAHRPGEKAVHIKAFRGSKDGYLFFLPNGILWAFKKPLLFLPHERIVGVSYVNVLQRTFNLSIEVDTSVGPGGERSEEFEFAMLDQEDFAGIDGFIKRHGLQDTSMAAQRKAKRLNVNKIRDADGNVVGNVEAGELQKAMGEAGGIGDGDLELDEEDEDEEDYDPGSEGESEGSGTSSEEDEDGEGEVRGEDGDDDDEDEL